MIINNHFHHRLMSTIDLLNKEFSTQDFAEEQPYTELLNSYKAIACNYARMENAIAVLSDLRTHTSHIYYGGFAQMLGTGLCGKESRVDSVWEEEIFRLIHPDDLARKHLQELCFFHFIKRQPPRKRAEYYLMSKLRMSNDTNNHLPALHRMFYISTPPGNALWLALCLYSPLLLDIPAQGIGQREQHKDIVRPGETGVKPHRQRTDKQRHCRNALHQPKHRQSAQAGDFREIAGQELD